MKNQWIVAGIGVVLFASLGDSAKAAAGPDLMVSDVVITPSYVKQKSTYDVKTRIKNVGAGDFSGSTNVAYFLCQGEPAAAELKSPRCSILSLQAVPGSGAPTIVSDLKAGAQVELAGRATMFAYLKPATIVARVNDASGVSGNDTKAGSLEIERPVLVPGDLELLTASVWRDVEDSHDVKLKAKVKQGSQDAVQVVARLCRDGNCVEQVRQTVTPSWTKGNSFYAGTIEIPFKLAPYVVVTDPPGGDFEITVSKTQGFDVDATNNQKVEPAPVKLCPKKYLKNTGKTKKVGGKKLVVYTCTKN